MNSIPVKIKQKANQWGVSLKHLLSVKKLLKTTLYHTRFYKISKKTFNGLHLGSGNVRIPGFLNIDASWLVSADVTARIFPINLADNSVEAVYASHLFEHTDRTKAHSILQEWHRVLSPKGELYLAVPDLEKLFGIYLENIKKYDDADARAKADKACRIIYGGQVNKYDYHFYGYSFETLKQLLTEVGFRDISIFDPRAEKIVAEEADASFAPISLNVKAIK